MAGFRRDGHKFHSTDFIVANICIYMKLSNQIATYSYNYVYVHTIIISIPF